MENPIFTGKHQQLKSLQKYQLRSTFRNPGMMSYEVNKQTFDIEKRGVHTKVHL